MYAILSLAPYLKALGSTADEALELLQSTTTDVASPEDRNACLRACRESRESRHATAVPFRFCGYHYFAQYIR